MKQGLVRNQLPQNGSAIREIREREGLSVSELARQVNISDSHLRNIELENRAARPEHLALIAKRLNCQLASIRRHDEAVSA